jgi:hypothetical protein
MDSKSDDTMGSAPSVDVDTAGRGGGQLEGMPGIHVVKSVGQDDWESYSNNSTHPKADND